MESGYLDDGYTIDGYIKAAPGMYPAVGFRYRPATPTERVALFEGWEHLPGEEKRLRIAKLLASHIKTWDLKTTAGIVPKCDQAVTYSRVHLGIYDRLHNIILGLEAPDVDPDKPVAAEEQNFAETGEKN